MLEPRPTLDDKWIDKIHIEAEQYGSEEFHCFDLKNWAGWLEKDEYNKFAHAFENRTKDQIDL